MEYERESLLGEPLPLAERLAQHLVGAADELAVIEEAVGQLEDARVRAVVVHQLGDEPAVVVLDVRVVGVVASPVDVALHHVALEQRHACSKFKFSKS